MYRSFSIHGFGDKRNSSYDQWCCFRWYTSVTYVCLLYNIEFIGSMYPENVWFCFENKVVMMQSCKAARQALLVKAQFQKGTGTSKTIKRTSGPPFTPPPPDVRSLFCQCYANFKNSVSPLPAQNTQSVCYTNLKNSVSAAPTQKLLSVPRQLQKLCQFHASSKTSVSATPTQ